MIDPMKTIMRLHLQGMLWECYGTVIMLCNILICINSVEILICSSPDQSRLMSKIIDPIRSITYTNFGEIFCLIVDNN